MGKRRGQNEGSISLRKDGRWEARVTVGYKSGRQRRKCIYGKTRQEVSRKLSSLLTDIERGLPVTDDKQTVRAYLEHWLAFTAKSRIRERTFTRYGELLNRHVIPAVGSLALTKLTPQRLDQLWSQMADGGLSPRTVTQARAILRSALNTAMKHGLVPRNASALTSAPRVERHQATFLTEEQAVALLKSAHGHPLEGIVCLGLLCGMRMGEILGLTWADIDLDSKRLTIQRQQQRVGSEIALVDTKTGKSVRNIELPAQAVAALKRHRDRQSTNVRPAAGERWIVSGRVFTNETGGPLENGTALRQFHRLLEAAKLPKMRLHDLRHSCATILLARGAPARDVMELLGHSTIAMTMNVYGHAMPNAMRNAASIMEKALAAKPAQTSSVSGQ